MKLETITVRAPISFSTSSKLRSGLAHLKKTFNTWRLWRNVQKNRRDFVKGDGIILHSFKDLD